MRDSDNLAVTAAVEEADQIANGVVIVLREVAEKLDTVFSEDVDDAYRAIKHASDALEAVQVQLDNCSDILGRVVE